jgi:hypothetical protein
VLFASIDALDPGPAHQALDATDVDAHARAECELDVDAPRPVGAMALGVDLRDDAG